MKTTTKSKQKAARAAFSFLGVTILLFAANLAVEALAAGKMGKATDMKMGEPKQAARPMSEMEGGCENFKIPLARQMAEWDKKEIRIQGAQDDKSTTELPSDKKINLTLYPQKKVSLLIKPEKEPAKGDVVHAGLAAMEVKEDGLYRVAMGSKVWLDLVEVNPGDEAGAKTVSAARFEMQTGCAKIFKAVEYNLQAGKKYFLQISLSQAPAVQILTTLAK